MFRRFLTVLVLLPLTGLLVSCGTVRRVVAPPLEVPESMLRCAEYPAVPGIEASDTELAVFMLRGEDAWADCRDALKAVGELVASQGGGDG